MTTTHSGHVGPGEGTPDAEAAVPSRRYGQSYKAPGDSALSGRADMALMTVDVRDAVLTHPVFGTLTGQRSEHSGPG
jgi:hypothetical protein